ncbi:MAG TPA: hypothetical protein VNK43_02980 [Gemmatimonadales bacterium]|nr:hypothetical protein [Gemmatimonadales bacterium]
MASLSILGVAFAVAASPAPTDGIELIRQMRARYEGKWYRTLTFVQTTTLPNGRVQTWYEAAEMPGKLRIDLGTPDSMNTLIFRNDSVYQFRGGKPAGSTALIHPLLLLGFDVYFLSPDETVRKLGELGFDLSKIREDRWQGRPVYVVGAEAGDLKTPQFWVDRERLVFVRLLQPSKQDPAVVEEIQFNGYRPLGGGWIETEVVFLRDGKLWMKEEYGDIREGMSFEPTLFDPGAWHRPGWVR